MAAVGDLDCFKAIGAVKSRSKHVGFYYANDRNNLSVVNTKSDSGSNGSHGWFQSYRRYRDEVDEKALLSVGVIRIKMSASLRQAISEFWTSGNSESFLETLTGFMAVGAIKIRQKRKLSYVIAL